MWEKVRQKLFLEHAKLEMPVRKSRYCILKRGHIDVFTVLLIKLADGIILVGVSLVILHGSSSATIQTLKDSLLSYVFDHKFSAVLGSS